MKDRYVLTLLECSGIQDYVFSSNNLAVNIGASENIYSVTDKWMFNALIGPHNLVMTANGCDFAEAGSIFQRDDLNAEVVYFGGGNALIIFNEMAQTKIFAKALSECVLLNAPMLKLHIAHEEFTPGESIAKVFEERLIPKMMKAKKQERPVSPMPGLAVTAQCVFTGQPAHYYEKVNPMEADRRYFSMEIKSKLAARPLAEERLHKLLPQVRGSQFDFVYNFEDFGTAGVSSYIGVVHIDGNGMGRRFREYSAGYKDAANNGSWIRAERDFSEAIKRVSSGALGHVIDTLLKTVGEKDHSWRRDLPAGEEGLCVKAKPKQGEKGIRLLPVRPLVFGGDDLTLVADGRLGLAVAKAYLDYCSMPGNELPDGKPMYSRAGIAITHAHFPFSRAYDVAESLLKSCKQDGSFHYPESFIIDWHVATSAMVDDLKSTRANEYTTEEGSLLMRPISLVDSADGRCWDGLQSLIGLFQADEKWAGQRGKQKALREALREGPGQVELFCKIYLNGKELPLYDHMPGFKKSGWQGGRCGYFDSLEAADFFIPLEGHN